MKKLILAIILIVGLVGSNSAQITLPEVIINRPDDLTQVIVAFKSMFKDAREPHWFYRDKNYAVTFQMNDINHHAVFRKDGNLVYHITYGNENSIPRNFKSRLHTKFKNYNIISVIHFQQDEKNMWFITGEGENDFLNVNIEGGVMSAGTRSKKYAPEINLVARYP